MVIPPPNITGSLHMGHALNITIQDIIVRYKRMQGFDTLWLPGEDHAGIATQNAVERELLKQGKTREDLGREEFLRIVWDWAKKYRKEIAKQIRELTLNVYTTAANYAAGKGIILADTKFEFGLKEELILIDEILTPDSSRFWPAEKYKTGCSPPSLGNHT